MTPPDKKKVAALIVAAGRGTRAGEGLPKQYRALGNTTVLGRTARLFASHPRIDETRVVIHYDDRGLYGAAVMSLAGLGEPVIGGATRQESVRLGLEALTVNSPDIVLVHDAARPFASSVLIGRAIDAIEAGKVAAVPGIPVTDTIKRVDGTGRVVETPLRASLRAIQTPQAFGFAALIEAHRANAGEDATDDAGLMERAGHTVSVFPGETGNIKLTLPEDFVTTPALTDIRTGTGYDVHAFGDGDHVMLGGVRIPHGLGVMAHSDGDVVLHALTDAILGALADGDIGSHFPPSDPAWRGTSSDRFLAHAAGLVAARGGIVAHADVTVVAEAPKVGPFRDAMRARIADILGIAINRVSVKATTSERLGFTGRGEGLAALATATVRFPEDPGHG